MEESEMGTNEVEHFEIVPTSNIRVGDCILHPDGIWRTVGQKDIRYDAWTGCHFIFGCNYRDEGMMVRRQLFPNWCRGKLLCWAAQPQAIYRVDMDLIYALKVLEEHCNALGTIADYAAWDHERAALLQNAMTEYGTRYEGATPSPTGLVVLARVYRIRLNSDVIVGNLEIEKNQHLVLTAS